MFLYIIYSIILIYLIITLHVNSDINAKIKTSGPVIGILSFLIVFGIGNFSYIKNDLLLDIQANWFGIIVGAIIYLSCGIVWSFYYWYVLIKRNIKNDTGIFNKSKLQISDHKNIITFWVIYWPLYLLGHIFGDGLFKMGHYLTSIFKSQYDDIAEKLYNSTEVIEPEEKDEEIKK